MDWEKKILSNVVKEEGTGCWIWAGRTNAAGSGIFTVDQIIDGKRKVDTYYAHHEIYKSYYGEFEARYLDHTCGNSRCCNPGHLQPRTLEVRLFGNLDKPDGENGCWIWTGTVRPNGYGSITIDGKSEHPHRASYEYFKGEIPEGMYICHTCNNALCINPDHLYAGTHTDNMRDMVVANRQARGEADGNSRLTVEEVREIRELFASGGYTLQQIADKFGVGRSTVKDIKSGRTWSWLE